MEIPFYKYHGTGNDFIVVDDRQEVLGTYSDKLVRALCERRLGIGADGFMVLRNREGYDFAMAYHNADGSQSLCGNGSRCAVHLAQQLGIIDQKAYFLTTDGPHQAYIKEGLIHVQLGAVTEIQTLPNGYLLNTGSPHYVQWVKDWECLDVYSAGKQIRNSPLFQKEGVNVNFVQLGKKNTLYMRTYERGVEDETLSCGTGVTAAALVAASRGYTSPITIKTKGGVLQVGFTKEDDSPRFRDIYLIGPAKLVFQGTIDLRGLAGTL